MSRLCLFAAIFSATFLLFQDAAADSWVRYQSPFELGPDHIFNLATKRTAFGGTDVIHMTEVCGPEGDYDCLISGSFALSVPRKGVPNGTTWRIGKFTFLAVGGGPIRIAGQDLSATFIDATYDDAPNGLASVRVIYDAKYGLVAWADLSWNVDSKGVPYGSPMLMNPMFAEDRGLWARGRSSALQAGDKSARD